MTQPGALPLQGVRVVELAVFIAAPSCCKCLSDLGAEVVKVEAPAGDTLRMLMKDLMPGRGWSAFYDVINMDKSSVALDVKGQGKQKLLALLKDADVLVTNVRLGGLQRLGLDYRTLSVTHPHLVYAHLTAWGLTGPDMELPGYDVGAFWAMTGMSATTAQPPNYATIPVGFGDTCAGVGLASGVINALTRRLRTGKGQMAENSLFRTGVWGVAATLFGADPLRGPVQAESDDIIPKYPAQPGVGADARNRTYTTKDKVRVSITLVGQFNEGGAEEMAARLARAVGLEAPPGPESGDAVQKRISTFDRKPLLDAFKKHGVPYAVMEPYSDHSKTAPTKTGWAKPLFEAGVIQDSEGKVSDIRYFVRTPYEVDQHRCGLKMRKPPCPVGQHTSQYLAGKWDTQRLQWPSPSSRDSDEGLKGLTVVELSDSVEVSTSLGSRNLSDAGAKVIRVVLAEDDAAEQQQTPGWYYHHHFGKEIKLCGSMAEAASAVRQLVDGGADAFLTNLPEGTLAALGLDAAALRANKPSLVHLTVTPWGSGVQGPRGELLAYWAASGLPVNLPGAPDPPKYYGGAMTALHVATLAGAALFRQRLTGEGASCHTSLVGCGAWSMLCMLPLGQINPHTPVLLRNRAGYYRSKVMKVSPVPTCNAFQTRDGMLVQLLGAELPRHFRVTYDSVERRWSVIRNSLLQALFVSVPRALAGKVWSALTRTPGDWKRELLPVFAVLNNTLVDEFGKRDWAEMRSVLEKAGVWHCRIRSPGQLLSSTQAYHGNCLRRDADGSGCLYAASPAVMYNEAPAAAAAKL